MDLEILHNILLVNMLTCLGLYIITVVAALTMRGLVYRFQAILFKMDEQTTDRVIFYYIAGFKLMFIGLFFTPWLGVYLYRVLMG